MAAPHIAAAHDSVQRCEFKDCRRKGNQVDIYLSAYLCDNHYSALGRLTNDYQNPNIDIDKISTKYITGIPGLGA